MIFENAILLTSKKSCSSTGTKPVPEFGGFCRGSNSKHLNLDWTEYYQLVCFRGAQMHTCFNSLHPIMLLIHHKRSTTTCPGDVVSLNKIPQGHVQFLSPSLQVSLQASHNHFPAKAPMLPGLLISSAILYLWLSTSVGVDILWIAEEALKKLCLMGLTAVSVSSFALMHWLDAL